MDILGPDKKAERQKRIHPGLLQNHGLINNNGFCQPNKHVLNYCQLSYYTLPPT